MGRRSRTRKRVGGRSGSIRRFLPSRAARAASTGMLHLSASFLTRGPTSVPAMWSSTTSGSTTKLSGYQEEEGEDEDDGRIGGSHRLTVTAPITHLLMKFNKRLLLKPACVAGLDGISGVVRSL